MIPIDGEFLMMYIFYIGYLIFLVRGAAFSKTKRFYVINLFFYSFYLGIMIYAFFDIENFKGGGSLVVLFYGWIFLLVHLVIYLTGKLYYSLKRTNK
ncbi:hypothetical protein [Aquimarina sp. 2201CG5-10]|uniref:hypothetical protein n=1 Tax=Aquimarina callyspongiae TaxID=3098150 RepID=UPI002AB5D39A|nr:hypothetical protein [Aquimarina sp. 2201CG5-10]MDY8135570.1 hypothetical protein [Aquimarina sp. 2201CG5-10]